MSTKKPTASTGATATHEATGESVQPEVKKSKAERNSHEDYSSSSLIARAYSAGYFPSFTHQMLFHCIVKLLDSNDAGNIDFNELLTEAQLHRSSALHIIRHMVNLGMLTVSFNTEHVIGEARKSWAYIKILHKPEQSEQLLKSA